VANQIELLAVASIDAVMLESLSLVLYMPELRCFDSMESKTSEQAVNFINLFHVC